MIDRASEVEAVEAVERGQTGQTFDATGWRAELALWFAADAEERPVPGRSPVPGESPEDAGRTRLRDRRHTGPLVVQRPFYPEDDRRVPHVYVLHPPGGLVGGDSLRLEVTARPRSHALLTTPAATKIYRSAGPLASQSLLFHVEAGARLEWLPQETILHDGAHASLSAEVHLGADGRFIGIDTLCFGLPARGETFATGRCRQRFEIWREGRPLFVERGQFDAAHPVHGAAWGLGGARVNGLMVVAPAVKDAAVLVRLHAAVAEVQAPSRAGVSVLGEGDALICRYLGPSAERARWFFQAVWGIVRPEVAGRPAVAPRIWAT